MFRNTGTPDYCVTMVSTRPAVLLRLPRNNIDIGDCLGIPPAAAAAATTTTTRPPTTSTTTGMSIMTATTATTGYHSFCEPKFRKLEKSVAISGICSGVMEENCGKIQGKCFPNREMLLL